MAADISRDRFDARRDHSGVLMQQGRVLLDADWNELVDIIDRRLRANAADLGSAGPRSGIGGVAVVPRTTPDGFRIEAGCGDVTIGIGRMYVDGLTVENHGTGVTRLDPLLRDPAGSDPTPYDEQPYWHTPDPLPQGRAMVYLDVWQRSVGPVQAPDLREVALGGPDTTTRTQTVWQVRAFELPDGSNVDCSTPDDDMPNGWQSIISPSAGRLTTGTTAVTEEDDPCELPPSGGYRGPENQTYRVEIHRPGPAGAATFKWSRDNGSIAIAIVEVVSSTRVRPASLGRDDVLRLRTGDWVEIIDDHREFQQRSGELRRIEVHEEDGTISWSDALPADLQMTSAEARQRHLLVRRWDQRGAIVDTDGNVIVDLGDPGADGEVPIPATGTAIVLEHGVTVTLEAAPGGFRQGDHWVFAARVADASVEQLVAEPPRGIHHHYARLAVIDPPAAETDCRVLWPPLDSGGDGCDCTVCVTAESHNSGVLTIQQAIDSVRATGGTVCMSVGSYRLPADGLDLARAHSVTLRGQGPRTLLMARGNGIDVTGSMFTTLQDFAVIRSSGGPVVELTSTVSATVERLTLLALGDMRDDDRVHGEAEARGSTIVAVGLNRVNVRTRVRDNVIVAPFGIGGRGTAGGADGALAARRAMAVGAARGPLLTAGLDIVDNILVCETAGIMVFGAAGHLLANTVRDNTVFRARMAGIALTGLVAPGGGIEVRGNTLVLQGDAITVGPSRCDVRDNDISGHGERRPGRDGIVVVSSELAAARGPVTITGNQIRDIAGTGIAVRVPVGDLDVSHNDVAETLGGIVMADRGGATSARIVHNVIRDVGRPDGQDEGKTGPVGIQVVGADHAIVQGNTVDGVGQRGRTPSGAAGIRVLAVEDTITSGNVVSNIGGGSPEVVDVGIHVGLPFARVNVHGNSSRARSGDVDEADTPAFTGLVVGSHAAVSAARDDGGDRDAREPRSDEYRTYHGERTYLFADDAVYVGSGAVSSGDRIAVIEGNTVTGGGRNVAALVGLPGDVTISGNQFRGPLQDAASALRLLAATASVQGNRGRGGEITFDLRVNVDRITVLGNVTTGAIDIDGTGLPPPWDALNREGI